MVTLVTEASVPSTRVKVSPINFIQKIGNPGSYSLPSQLLLHIQKSLRQLSQPPLGTKSVFPLNINF